MLTIQQKQELKQRLIEEDEQLIKSCESVLVDQIQQLRNNNNSHYLVDNSQYQWVTHAVVDRMSE